jgi:4-hydroxybenzoate polyprenyltransferase
VTQANSSHFCRLSHRSLRNPRYGSNHYPPHMGPIEASIWGLAGGIAAGLVSMSAAVVAAGFHWPWRGRRDGIWPHIFVGSVGTLVGALAASAAHTDMTGPWPAFIVGVCAPSVIRGVLARVEVAERKQAEGMVSDDRT